MKKGLILSLICILILGGCGKIPKLQNGEEAVVTFKKGDVEHQISAEDLFTELKNNFGLEATVKLIDTYILENEFKDNIENAKDMAKNYIKAMIEAYGGEEELLNAIRQNTNYTSIEAYQEYLYVSFMESHANEEYAKTLITDKEINEYYKNDVKGDIEVYHILLTPEVTDDMSDDDKKIKEDNAKTVAQDIIKKLDAANDKLEEFKKLAKEFSDDDATKDVGGNLGYINYGDLSENYDELIDTAYKLKDGEYSKSIITTELGYHVIYRNASKEKESLDDLKNDIITTLANKKLEEDSDIALNTMKYYRKLYNLNIVDSTLNRQYGIYLNNLANS